MTTTNDRTLGDHLSGRHAMSPAMWEEIDEVGFVVVPGVVDESDVAELREAVDATLVEDERRYGGLPGKVDFIALDLAHYGGPFLKLLDNDRIDELFGAILGERWTLYSYTSTVMRPDVAQYTAEIHTDMARQSGNYPLGMVMTLALDDFTLDNGATWYLPGSHNTHTDRPAEKFFYANSVRVNRRAGDAVFFDPRVWHAGGTNTTDKVRSGLTIYGVRSFMKPRLDFPRMIQPHVIEHQSERVKRILGFNTRVPTSMEEFYVPASERLYKGGQG